MRRPIRLVSLFLTGLIAVVVLCVVMGAAGRTAVWIANGGTHVFVPWSPNPLQADPEQQNRRRTRSGAGLQHAEPCDCAILFGRRRPDAGLDAQIIDMLAGFNGLTHIAVDCCLSRDGEPWMIESTFEQTEAGVIDGPHYAPQAAWARRDYARVRIEGMIDCRRLYADLRRMVENPVIHQKKAEDWMSHLTGENHGNLVTCSGMVARCIGLQPGTRLAQALDRALHDRLTYGEVTPNDLARAVTIAGAEGFSTEAVSTYWERSIRK